MSVPEFREIFQREIDHYVTKYQRKSLDTPHTVSSFGSPGGSTVHSQIPNAEFDALRNLASTMADRVLQRVANHAQEWGVEATDASQAGGNDALESRCAELEAELRRKRAEEARLREEVAAKCKSCVSERLQASERKLLEVQNAVTLGDSAVKPASADRERELKGQFQEHVKRINERLAAVQQLTADLDKRRSRLELLELQQQKGLPSVEAKLGGAWDEMLDDEDKELAKAIDKGEQVCKRMRRHAGGGA